jgi:hypothetical protein
MFACWNNLKASVKNVDSDSLSLDILLHEV